MDKVVAIDDGRAKALEMLLDAMVDGGDIAPTDWLAAFMCAIMKTFKAHDASPEKFQKFMNESSVAYKQICEANNG